MSARLLSGGEILTLEKARECRHNITQEMMREKGTDRDTKPNYRLAKVEYDGRRRAKLENAIG